MEINLEFLIPIGIFASIAFMVKVISDNKVKHKLIDKKILDENIKYLFLKSTFSHPVVNIKWSFILMAIGLPLLLVEIFPTFFSDRVIIAFMFIFSGIGFYLYYFIAQKEYEKDKKNKSE